MAHDLRGVLFDVDGTLVDSGYHHALAWWQAFRQQGLDVPIATLHRAIGMGGDKLIDHVLDQEGLDRDAVDPSKLDGAQAAIFSTYWATLRTLPAARTVIERSRAAGLRTVLASSAGPDELAVLRRLLDADELLDATTGKGDADQSKPAPDLVQAALRRADLEPEHAVFVGDSVWDVQAAAASGVPCVGVECGGTSASELREAGAVETYRDPRDLLANWSGSALAR